MQCILNINPNSMRTDGIKCGLVVQRSTQPGMVYLRSLENDQVVWEATVSIDELRKALEII